MTNDLVRTGPITFEGHVLTPLIIDGRFAVLAREVGKGMGYGKNGQQLVSLLGDEWSNRLRDGKDCRHATHAELVAGYAESSRVRCYRTLENQAANADIESDPKFNPFGALVLFESGVLIVTMLSKKPAGDRLRYFLTDEVVPAYQQLQIAGPAPEIGGPAPAALQVLPSPAADHDTAYDWALRAALSLREPARSQRIDALILHRIVAAGGSAALLQMGQGYRGEKSQRAAHFLLNRHYGAMTNKALEEKTGIAAGIFGAVRLDLEKYGDIERAQTLYDGDGAGAARGPGHPGGLAPPLGGFRQALDPGPDQHGPTLLGGQEAAGKPPSHPRRADRPVGPAEQARRGCHGGVGLAGPALPRRAAVRVLTPSRWRFYARSFVHGRSPRR